MLESLRGRVIGVVGWKDSGKTTLVERLVTILSAGGYRVGTVKHVDADVLLQPEAKDSARHLDAGAETVVVLGEGPMVLGQSGDGDLETVAAGHLSLCDIIIVEGFKHADIPKVVVFSGTDDILKETENIVAVVYREDKPEGYPGFETHDVEGLVDFLRENEILKPSTGAATLLVNGKPVPLNEFVQASLAGVVRGFIGALHDVGAPSTIQITVKA
jgi:molybdopterin-guanine dinucleotide biosynthesis protein B